MNQKTKYKVKKKPGPLETSEIYSDSFKSEKKYKTLVRKKQDEPRTDSESENQENSKEQQEVNEEKLQEENEEKLNQENHRRNEEKNVNEEKQQNEKTQQNEEKLEKREKNDHKNSKINWIKSGWNHMMMIFGYMAFVFLFILFLSLIILPPASRQNVLHDFAMEMKKIYYENFEMAIIHFCINYIENRQNFDIKINNDWNHNDVIHENIDNQTDSKETHMDSSKSQEKEKNRTKSKQNKRKKILKKENQTTIHKQEILIKTNENLNKSQENQPKNERNQENPENYEKNQVQISENQCKLTLLNNNNSTIKHETLTKSDENLNITEVNKPKDVEITGNFSNSEENQTKTQENQTKTQENPSKPQENQIQTPENPTSNKTKSDFFASLRNLSIESLPNSDLIKLAGQFLSLDSTLGFLKDDPSYFRAYLQIFSAINFIISEKRRFTLELVLLKDFSYFDLIMKGFTNWKLETGNKLYAKSLPMVYVDLKDERVKMIVIPLFTEEGEKFSLEKMACNLIEEFTFFYIKWLILIDPSMIRSLENFKGFMRKMKLFWFEDLFRETSMSLIVYKDKNDLDEILNELAGFFGRTFKGRDWIYLKVGGKEFKKFKDFNDFFERKKIKIK